MSFSYNVKEELSRLSSNTCCQRAELASLVRMAGSIKIIGGQRKIFLQIQTVHAPTARRIYKLLRKNSISPVQIAVKKNNFLKKGACISFLIISTIAGPYLKKSEYYQSEKVSNLKKPSLIRN